LRCLKPEPLKWLQNSSCHKSRSRLCSALGLFFADERLVRIAFCESSLDHTTADGSVKRGHVDSRDTGLMQINLRYHAEDAERLGLDIENEYDNMRYAKYLARRDGLQTWNASRPCWSKIKLPKVEAG